ncbi:GNAT family N-acetyltransferase [Bombilactobacillus folatiphilus]|uniref:GNAT family N-acetyltransferase n=1 Tax=Bombilactobacillus folatiphilus TaxID=2923362 RepID=A0ABY4PAW1_9LACO|nr:GNAT family N-acetyltransferase [Bombilactobacillus folatiphilus]UQS82849.1 GNAT family N-acetyltransferase [Bombilactobacillus folatiphilus]
MKKFGSRNDDVCLVSLSKGNLVGAAWIRKIRSYGYVDADTPELSIALKAEFRGQGYGTNLLNSLIDLLKGKKYKKISLSVDNRNIPAYKLYLKNNFKTVRKCDHTEIMVVNL